MLIKIKISRNILLMAVELAWLLELFMLKALGTKYSYVRHCSIRLKY